MIKNYLKTSAKILLRNKSYSLLNIMGLSLGITCALIIFLILDLQLSYNRKNFEKIELQDKTHLALRDVPRIDYAKPPIGAPKNSGLTYLKLHLVVEQEIPDGSFEDWFLNDKIVVAFDVLAKLQQVSDKSGLEIVLVSIDTDSATMDTKYLSFLGRIFSGKVMNGVKDKLKKTSAKWVTGNEKIPGKLEFPPQVLGLKMDIVQLVMDPAGQLVMYLNFASGAR